MRHLGVEKGSRVAVVGLGGLGHMAVKFAKAMGANTTVLSHSPEKEGDAKRLGADGFIHTEDSSVLEKHASSFDFVVDTVSAKHDFESYLKLLAYGGTMVLLGVPEPSPVAPSALQSNRVRLVGSNVGGTRDTQEMLEFCSRHGIVADVEVIPIQRVNAAFDLTVRSEVRYRFVIDMASLKSS
jgi:uncharacterized zinc-type alcohol dehydrogenase-like protein